MKGLMVRMSLGLAAALGSWPGAAEQSLEYQPYVLAHPEGLPNGLHGRLKANGLSTRGNYSVVVRDDTAGRYTLEELTLAPGAVPKVAAEATGKDQAWYLLSGELHLDFKSADGWHNKVLKPGDFAFVPLGIASRVSNPTEQDARYLLWLSLPRDPKSN